MEVRKRRRQSGGSLCRQKKSRRLLPYIPCSDPHRRLEQMASLATALTSVGVSFTDKLLYSFAPRMANTARLEKGGMQVIPSLPLLHIFEKLASHSPFSSRLIAVVCLACDECAIQGRRIWWKECGWQSMGKEDKGTLEACKAMCSRGEWPPLMVTHDSRQGYSSFSFVCLWLIMPSHSSHLQLTLADGMTWFPDNCLSMMYWATK